MINKMKDNTPPAPSREGNGYPRPLFSCSHSRAQVSYCDGSISLPSREGAGGVLSSILLSLFLLLNIPSAHSQEAIRFIPRSLTVSDDSVRIDLTIRAKGISMPTSESLILTPSLRCGKKRVALPPVVFSGSRRARFDRREETVNPDRNRPVPYHVWVCGRRRNDYTLRYMVSLPYASWMEHASLCLTQTGRDCCTEWPLADDVLTADIDLPSPCELLAEAQPVKTAKASATVNPAVIPDTLRRDPAPASVVEVPAPYKQPTTAVLVERRVAATLYIDYPRGSSAVDPLFGNNAVELGKVEKLLAPLLGNPYVHIKEIRITGYASPDGAYYNNETLAKSRSQGFKSYLTRSFGLQDYPFRVAWVAEDWEGLRPLLKGKSYEKAALFIIDNYGIFEGRERFLMEFAGGAPYKEMLRELFPKLRRIEVHIIYNEQND